MHRGREAETSSPGLLTTFTRQRICPAVLRPAASCPLLPLLLAVGNSSYGGFCFFLLPRMQRAILFSFSIISGPAQASPTGNIRFRNPQCGAVRSTYPTSIARCFPRSTDRPTSTPAALDDTNKCELFGHSSRHLVQIGPFRVNFE